MASNTPATDKDYLSSVINKINRATHMQVPAQESIDELAQFFADKLIFTKDDQAAANVIFPAKVFISIITASETLTVLAKAQILRSVAAQHKEQSELKLV